MKDILAPDPPRTLAAASAPLNSSNLPLARRGPDHKTVEGYSC